MPDSGFLDDVGGKHVKVRIKQKKAVNPGFFIHSSNIKYNKN